MNRFESRDQKILAGWAAGAKAAHLAEVFTMSTANVERIIAKEKAKIDNQTADELRTRLLSVADHVLAGALEIFDKPVPARFSANGRELTTLNRDTGEVLSVPDHTDQIKAGELILKVTERMSRLVGSDAPKKHEHDHVVAEAVQEAAARAMRGRLKAV